MMSIWVTSIAMAGSIFVNGINVDGLKGQTFEGVNVTIDAKGNVHIDAPRYEIEVVDPAASAPAPAPAVTPVPPVGGAIPQGAWWLVSEDRGSAGHTVTVIVNGTRVRTIRSGDAAVILDIGPYLARGTNHVRVESTSVGASGGAFYVYLGSGANRDGTVVIDQPQVQYGLGASRTGTHSREYEITLP